MQLRRFRHAVRHARAVGPNPGDGRRDDERAAVGVRSEGRQRGAHEVRLRAHVDGEAGVPVGGGGRGEVGEGAEARVALRGGGEGLGGLGLEGCLCDSLVGRWGVCARRGRG